MFKSVSEFAKLFSTLFLICGIYFALQKCIPVASIALASFVILMFIDSDWSFENLNIPNHNKVVGFITFVLIFVNIFFIFEEMKFAPLLNQVDKSVREQYLKYEDKLFADIKPCTDRHNFLMNKIKDNKKIDAAEEKFTQKTCYDAISVIDKEQIPATLPNDIKKLCEENRTEMKRVAVNLTSYNYKKDSSQQALVSRIKTSISTVIKNMEKIRYSMKIKDTLSKDKKTFLNI